jgi:hypothetical protein
MMTPSSCPCLAPVEARSGGLPSKERGGVAPRASVTPPDPTTELRRPCFVLAMAAVVKVSGDAFWSSKGVTEQGFYMGKLWRDAQGFLN